MAHPEWKIHGGETLAAYVPETELRGFLEKRIAVPPDHAALLIRDGALVDALIGAQFSVGGLWQSLKGLIGGPHALRLLVADLKPFPVIVPLEGFTKDHVEIEAELAFELQLNPEKPTDIMGLVRDGRSVTRTDVFERVRPHLQERVLFHELVQHDAEHLRANRGLQDRFQADCMREVERIAGDLGLLVRALSVNWGLNEDEAQAIKVRSLARKDELRDVQYARVRREMSREAENTTFRMRTDLDIAKVEAMTATELEQVLLRNELALEDAREAGERGRELARLGHELELRKTDRLAGYDERLGDAQNELERTKIEVERKRLEAEFEADVQKLELEVGAAGHEVQFKRLSDLDALEEQKEQARHGRAKDDHLTRHAAEMEKKAQEASAELEKLKLQATMDPDQLLAVQAGLSPEIAAVFAEKARAEVGGADREGLLREMLELSKSTKADSEAQARAMFDRAVENLAKVGVAAGSGGEASPPSETPDGETVECPGCHRHVPVSDRFCRKCGHQLRT